MVDTAAKALMAAQVETKVAMVAVLAAPPAGAAEAARVEGAERALRAED